MKLSLEAVNQKRFAIAVFTVISLLFVLPIFSNFSYWGSYDWDQHMFYHGSAQVSILKFHQFPLWNPFYCGGNLLLANPQSPFLSPFFLFVLLFGAVYGLKIEVIAYLIIGLFGMWLLARQLGIKGLAAYFAPIIFMLSSWYALHTQAGHTTFFPFALLPFTFLFYLKALKNRKFSLLAALMLALMLLSGGVYPFYFTTLLLCLHGLFDVIETRKAKPVIVLATIFVFAFLLASIKLLPMLELVTKLPAIKDEQLNSYSMLSNALFSRTQSIEHNNYLFGREIGATPAQKAKLMYTARIPWGWHEYGAYVGVVPAILALLSFVNYKKNWKLIFLAIIFLLLSLGSFSPINIWSLLQKLSLFNSLHGPSRLIIMFVFCTALLASKAASDIRTPKKTVISLLLIAVITIDLILVSRPLFAATFNFEPVKMEASTYEYKEYVHVFTSMQYKTQYLYMLYNFDTVNCYERVHPTTKVMPQFIDAEMETGKQYEKFIGNAYFAETNQSFNLSYFSPNKVKVKVTNVTEPKTLVLNQNYWPGWKAKGRKAFFYNGLIAANTTKEEEVTFYYLPRSFVIGTIISIISFCFAGAMIFRRARK
jgi:hypothetical protein